MFDHFAATAALNSLTLGVAGVALFISPGAKAASANSPCCGHWGDAAAIDAAENWGKLWLLAVLTLLLALPLGLLLAWCLDAGDQRAGVGLAPAVAGVPVAARTIARAGAAGHAVGVGLAAVAAVSQPSGGLVEDVCP